MVICLEQGADCLHMVQLMPLPFQNHNHLLLHLNPDWFYPYGTGLPRLSWKREPLNGCSDSSGSTITTRKSPSALILNEKWDVALP